MTVKNWKHGDRVLDLTGIDRSRLVLRECRSGTVQSADDDVVWVEWDGGMRGPVTASNIIPTSRRRRKT